MLTALGIPLEGRDGVERPDRCLVGAGTCNDELDTRLAPGIPETIIARSRTRRIAFAVSTSVTLVPRFRLRLGVVSVPAETLTVEYEGVMPIAAEVEDPPDKLHKFLILPTVPLASRLIDSGSTFGKLTSFQALLSGCLCNFDGRGGKFSSLSSPSSIPPNPLTPTPLPARCSTRPARAKCIWRSLIDPSIWTDSRFEADREICLYLGFCNGAIAGRGGRGEVDRADPDASDESVCCIVGGNRGIGQ